MTTFLHKKDHVIPFKEGQTKTIGRKWKPQQPQRKRILINAQLSQILLDSEHFNSSEEGENNEDEEKKMMMM